jgi:hypothetical protein
MSNYDISGGRCADWGKWLEIASPMPSDGKHTEKINVEKNTKVLIVTVSMSGERPGPPPRDLEVDLVGPDGWRPTDREDNEAVFVLMHGKTPSVIIRIDPPEGPWQLTVYSGGQFPFEINACAFKNVSDAPVLQASLATPGTPRLRCRICKTMTKALALAIATAGAAHAFPAALLAAVAAYLKITTVAAAAFIGAVVGDTVNAIAERLCRAIRLC